MRNAEDITALVRQDSTQTTGRGSDMIMFYEIICVKGIPHANIAFSELSGVGWGTKWLDDFL